jgi:hypothetical protein
VNITIRFEGKNEVLVSKIFDSMVESHCFRCLAGSEVSL